MIKKMILGVFVASILLFGLGADSKCNMDAAADLAMSNANTNENVNTNTNTSNITINLPALLNGN